MKKKKIKIDFKFISILGWDNKSLTISILLSFTAKCRADLKIHCKLKLQKNVDSEIL